MLRRYQQFLLFGTVLIIISLFVLLNLSKFMSKTCYNCYILEFQNSLNYYKKNFIRFLLSSSDFFYFFSSNEASLIYFPFEESSCKNNIMVFPFLLAVDTNDICYVSKIFSKFPIFTNFSFIFFDKDLSRIYIYGNESYYVDLSTLLEIKYFDLYVEVNRSFSESYCYYVDYFPLCFSKNSFLLDFFDDIGLCFYDNEGTLEISFSKNISRVRNNVVKVRDKNYYLYIYANSFKVNLTERKVYIYSKDFCLKFSNKFVSYNVSLFKIRSSFNSIKIIKEISITREGNEQGPLSVEECFSCNFSKVINFIANKFKVYLILLKNYTKLYTNASCFIISSTLSKYFNKSIEVYPGLYYIICSNVASISSDDTPLYFSNEFCILTENKCLNFFKDNLHFPFELVKVKSNIIQFVSNHRENSRYFYYVCNCNNIYCSCLVIPKYYVSSINSTHIQLTQKHTSKILKVLLPKTSINVLDVILFYKDFIKFYKICYSSHKLNSYFSMCK